jgi:NAD(P)-dependent dehydrogenase (short-subunit alcohol dehydrogenase family)
MPTTTALVTGASSGIGRALAKELARRGARVVLAARRAELLHQVRERIVADGHLAEVEPMDVSDGDATVRAIEALDDRLGLDLVVACAGVGPADPFAPAYSYDNLRGPCHVNFCGAVATLTAILPRMVERRRGHLAAVSSLSALIPLADSAPYCSPKAGLDMLLDCIRLDVAAHGVAVTTIHLGFVDTPMVAHRAGPMPQLMSAAAAAERIADALPARPARIDLPRALALATRAAAALPRPLRDRLLGQRVGVN